ncbi:hypothetical protein FNV43_RR26927 [Rhamnella rubrinervis]|uniref:Carboxypeptidase n=1 Tax=Rhamnella rubrinervis TaxID=2594499 RepID=A0A8K0DNH5_9ROSA|nr:hypothetical protein FNV43_RR26927 [Rhamnella rubrinervis]
MESGVKLLLLLLISFSVSIYIFFALRSSSSFASQHYGRTPLISISRSLTGLFPKEALPTKSGYLSINPSASSSAIFYAFYEALKPTSSSLSQTPLLVWLQGGPGCSSMYGNFLELGPWRVNFHNNDADSFILQRNPGSWNRKFGVIFLDNPIGTGFSIAATPQEIPRDELSVAKHLFIAITAFMELNPSFKSRPVYIAGESYAGKYVPAIGYYILKKNAGQLSEHRRSINFAGIAIGNGLTDPVTQVGTHALNAYFSGLINQRQKGQLEKIQSEAIRFAKMELWGEATNARYAIMDSLQSMTGLATMYDYTKKAPYKIGLVTDFLQNKKVKRALGVKESVGFTKCSDAVKAALHEDVMKSVKEMVEYLLVRKSKVLLYQGQFDLWDGVVSTEAWVETLRWEEIGKFMSAERKVWKNMNTGELAGYVQKWRNLSNVVFFGAGHLVPADQPLNSQAMIEDWVSDQGLFGDLNLWG